MLPPSTYLRHEPRLEGAEAAVARPRVVKQLDAVEACENEAGMRYDCKLVKTSNIDFSKNIITWSLSP